MINLLQKMKDFNRRWSIKKNESSKEAFLKFRNGVFNIFQELHPYLDSEDILAFCAYFGIHAKMVNHLYNLEASPENVWNKLREDISEIQLYESLEVLGGLKRDNVHGYGKNLFYNKLQQLINFSTLNIAITQTNTKDIVLYPKGEEVLDEDLVNTIFSFLKALSNKHYVEALQFYQAKKYEKSAESIRRSLEEFLREKLNNSK